MSDLYRRTSAILPSEMRQYIHEERIDSFVDLTNAIAAMDSIIATRFHGIVISYMLNKPVLGIAYAPKTYELMAQMGQADYVLDILQFDVESAQRKFILLEATQEVAKNEISQRLTAQRLALSQQYDEVLALIQQ